MDKDNMDKIAVEIADVFSIIYRNMIRRKDDNLDFNMSGQTALISVLNRRGRCQMSELGRLLLVTKPNITFLVDKLEKEGLIRRVSDEKDRRVTNVELTDKGKEAAGKNKTVVIDRIKDALSKLDGNELEEIEGLLEALLPLLRKMKVQEE